MKRLCLLCLILTCSLAVQAQTNMTGLLSTPRGPTLITSDRGDFDLGAREAIYLGHVHVDDPQMKLACEKLIADVPQSGSHVSHIVAQTNVVIDFLDNQGHTNHATADQAVYVYVVQAGVTNETVTLTGDPRMENLQGTLTGDVIVWDRQNNHLSASNQRMVFRQGLTGIGRSPVASAADTNAPAADAAPTVPTNEPAQPK